MSLSFFIPAFSYCDHFVSFLFEKPMIAHSLRNLFIFAIVFSLYLFLVAYSFYTFCFSPSFIASYPVPPSLLYLPPFPASFRLLFFTPTSPSLFHIFIFLTYFLHSVSHISYFPLFPHFLSLLLSLSIHLHLTLLLHIFFHSSFYIYLSPSHYPLYISFSLLFSHSLSLTISLSSPVSLSLHTPLLFISPFFFPLYFPPSFCLSSSLSPSASYHSPSGLRKQSRHQNGNAKNEICCEHGQLLVEILQTSLSLPHFRTMASVEPLSR